MRHCNHTNKTPHLKGRRITIDTEGTGLDPYHGHRIFCWHYITDADEEGFMLKNKSTLHWLECLLNNSDKEIAFQNAKYDLKMLSFEGIDVLSLKAKIHCTLIMSKVLDSVSMNHDLRALSRRYLHRDSTDKDAIERWITKNKRSFIKSYGRPPNFSDAPSNLLKRRVSWDTQCTHEIFEKLYPRVQKICPELYETERQLMFVCIDMENTGVLIDISRAIELRDKAQESAEHIERELNELVCPLIIEKKKRGKKIREVIKEFNPNSGAIHLPAAFKKLGIPLKYKTQPKKGKKGRGKTGGGNWCFDEYAMVRYVSKPLASIIHTSGRETWDAPKFLKEVDRAVRKYHLHRRELLPPYVLKYRELTKLISTYYNHLIEDCVDVYKTPTGRIVGTLHCQFNQSEAMTGRFSCSHPNLQNMPRLLGPRECFIPRKGKRNWHGDYEQVEMRFYVHFSKDKKMASKLSSDLHRYTASQMYSKVPKDITKEERERAGTINFVYIYGAGAARMAETLSKKGAPTNEAQAKRFIEKYDSIYPSVRRTARQLSKQLRRRGYLINPFGRRYYIPGKLSYKALNYMCQGTSADQIKKAMVECWLWLRSKGLRTKLIMTIHDELVFEVPFSEEKIVIPKITKIMEDLNSYFVSITVGWETANKRWSQKIKVPKDSFN